jgi:hypothetical protein
MKKSRTGMGGDCQKGVDSFYSLRKKPVEPNADYLGC